MARYIVNVHAQDGRPVDTLGPVNFISTARKLMVRDARLDSLPEADPAEKSDLLEVWAIGQYQYRIETLPEILVSSVQAVAAFG